MNFVYSFAVFIPSMVIVWIVLRFLQKRGRPACSGYALGYVLTLLVPFLMMLIVLALASWYYYDGLCYGVWECSFWEYLGEELRFAELVFLPSVALSVVGITLSFVFHWFFARRGFLENAGGDQK